MIILALIAILAMASVLMAGVLYPNGIFGSQGLTHLTVSASGVSYGYPQVATIYVKMNGTGNNAAIAAANLSLTLSQFNFTILKYLNNNSSRISTQSYSLQRVYNSSKYEASEMVSLSVPQVANVSAILGTLSLIQNVFVIQTSSSLSSQQSEQLIQSALGLAIQNATSQAQVAAGSNEISIKNMTVSKGYVYPMYPAAYSAGANAGSAQNPLFFNGREGVQEQVTVEFVYK
ncbi:MAG: SIMPL domain-containing protein [Candidatus Micrarchaeaceae archaeon]